VKSEQTHPGQHKLRDKVTAATLLVALGIIYGDIGTSPLYVLKAIVGTKEITEKLVLGALSCIIWTLVIQTTVKYIWLTLKADNDGEGGIFSLYALVRRHAKWLVIPTILGATTLLADGIITPPISVSSAVEGLTLVKGLESIPTVPIVVVIISLLFFFQRFGTRKVGVAFGPVMVVWFLMLMVLGLSQLVHQPGVLAAFNPVFAYRLLVEYPQGFWLLGAVFLATTGAEALYSDLGHCGRKNIRISWAFVKTCLLVNYLGQGAWMLANSGGYLNGRNPFFEIMPHWWLAPGILVATAATIIASQALISGSYTLINEAVNLNFWPRIAIRQPSDVKGQIYIPSVNLMLWAGCVLMTLYFQSSANMEAAYGFSITVAMMMTTLLLTFFLRYRLRWSWWIVLAIGLVFATVELSFFIANVAKIKERWMFLFFELFIFLVMYIWYTARKQFTKFTSYLDLGKYAQKFRDLSEDTSIPKFATHLVYLTKAERREMVEEKVVESIFARRPKRADVYWLVHLRRTEHPHTLTYDVSELLDDKVIRIDINIGFKVQPRTEVFFRMIMKDLVENRELNLHNREDGSTPYNEEPDIRFVVIRRFLSVENEFGLREGFLLRSYLFLKRLAQSDSSAFGLDPSDVHVELAPLVTSQSANPKLIRNRQTPSA
jgi:KUP system potassium uptake protein